MNLFHLKRTLMTPYIRWMRYKERDQTGFIKAALEVNNYSPTFYRFIGANMVNPNLLFEAPLNENSVVFDVGAHQGDWAARIVELYDPRIVLFEPDPESIPVLKRRFAKNPKISLFECGLHHRDETLHLNMKGLGSTVFEEGPANARGSVPVSLRDVAAVLDELGHPTIDLFKVNIEGGEYDVLERMIGSGQMARVRCLLVQFHEWRNSAHFRRWRIRRGLRKTHRLEWDFPFVWEKWIARDAAAAGKRRSS